MIKTLFTGHPYLLSGKPALGMLLFRIAMGSAFMLHGLPKIQNAFSWMTDAGMAGVPAILQALAAFSEFGGGIALILGLLTPLATLGIMATMVGALMMVHIPAGHPFVSMGGPSYEIALVYLVSAFMIFTTGPGQYSVDAMLQKNMDIPEPLPTA